MDSLVSTEWLANALGDDRLVVLDASMHLPAAQRDALIKTAAALARHGRAADVEWQDKCAAGLAPVRPFIENHFSDVEGGKT